MWRSPWLRPIIAVLLLAAVLAGGCSVLRLGYGQGPRLVMAWLDGTLDLEGEQVDFAREAIERWFAWHRRSELPMYAALLEQAADEATRPTTPAAVCAWQQRLRARSDAALAASLADFAALVPMLTARQLDHLERYYEKSNAEFGERPVHERIGERLQRVYGDLDAGQQRWLAARLAGSAAARAGELDTRRARQRDVVRTLRALRATGASREAALPALRALATRIAWRGDQDSCAWLAEWHALALPAQRATARQRLLGWAADLRALVGAPDESPATASLAR